MGMAVTVTIKHLIFTIRERANKPRYKLKMLVDFTTGFTEFIAFKKRQTKQKIHNY